MSAQFVTVDQIVINYSLGIDPDEQLLVSSFDGPIDRFVNVSADVEDNVTHKVSLKNILIFGDSKFSLSISVNKNTEEES